MFPCPSATKPGAKPVKLTNWGTPPSVTVGSNCAIESGAATAASRRLSGLDHLLTVNHDVEWLERIVDRIALRQLCLVEHEALENETARLVRNFKRRHRQRPIALAAGDLLERRAVDKAPVLIKNDQAGLRFLLRHQLVVELRCDGRPDVTLQPIGRRFGHVLRQSQHVIAADVVDELVALAENVLHHGVDQNGLDDHTRYLRWNGQVGDRECLRAGGVTSHILLEVGRTEEDAVLIKGPQGQASLRAQYKEPLDVGTDGYRDARRQRPRGSRRRWLGDDDSVSARVDQIDGVGSTDEPQPEWIERVVGVLRVNNAPIERHPGCQYRKINGRYRQVDGRGNTGATNLE